MLKWFSLIIILLNMLNNLYAQKDPDSPKDPSSNFSFNDSNIKTFPAEIICAGKKGIKGNIYLRIANIYFIHQEERIQLKIGEIKSIEFLEWQEFADKKNACIFYPSKVLLTVKNGRQYILKKLQEFNKIEFSGNGRKMNLYTYFYDYWEKGRWRNSNANEKAYPIKNPLPGTLLKIIFNENNESMDEFLKHITQ